MMGSDKKHRNDNSPKRWKPVGFIFIALLVVVFLIVSSVHFFSDKSPEQVQDPKQEPDNEIVDGIHLRTGLKEGAGLSTVITHCTACHSAQLIIQNRMNKERWNATIRWMQETQNLWDLGANQDVIVDYLVKNYPVYSKGRRENLKNIEWYDLSD